MTDSSYLILITSDAGGLNNYELVSEAFNQIQRTLLEFCVSFYSHVPVSKLAFLFFSSIFSSGDKTN